MNDMTDLQQLAADNRAFIEAFRRYQRGDSLGETIDLVRKIENKLDAHADAPEWFPVKFKKGDWVAWPGVTSPYLVLGLIKGEIVARNLEGLVHRIHATKTVKISTREVGVATKHCDDYWLGRSIQKIMVDCEHFKMADEIDNG